MFLSSRRIFFRAIRSISAASIPPSTAVFRGHYLVHISIVEIPLLWHFRSPCLPVRWHRTAFQRCSQ